jgi:hypothetical protein
MTEQIIREHPEYVARKAMWSRYADLYAGGEAFATNASEYLVRRHREPGDVYGERLNRVFYENYIGSIIDWYGATLFRREPVLAMEGGSEKSRAFFHEFAEDCDRKGSSLAQFFRRMLNQTLVYGSGWVLVDFPRVGAQAANRLEEDLLGKSRAYLVDLTPRDVINWSRDEHGQLEWMVVRTQHRRKQSLEEGDWVMETRWTVFDRQRFRIFLQTEAGGKKSAVEQVDEGLHGMAARNRVPAFEMRVSEGLWLMNKASHLQLEHFNKSNALSWALTMGLFAMPVVYSDREWNQMVGESYYIQLGPEDKFGWTEPEGKVYQIAADNLSRLQEEVYRVCYLQHQAKGRHSGQQAQSGLSKQRDYLITQEVLRAYGDLVKDVMKYVLRGVVEAREDEISIDVSGLDDFDIAEFSTELEDAERLLKLGMESPTLEREVFRKLAFKYLCDVKQSTKDRIAAEITHGIELKNRESKGR